MVRYVSVDFVASELSAATSGLMPLLVLAIIGADASAYVYLSWTIAYTVHFLSENVGMSFITEAARDPDRMIDFARKTLVHSLRIVVPLAIGVSICAPLALRAFGADYAAHATHLLQLLTLAAIPNAVIVTYLSVARVRRRMGVIVVISAVQSVATLVLAVVLLRVIGLTGVGVAWLVSETAIAAVLVLGEFRTLWLPYVKPSAFRNVVKRTRVVSRHRATLVASAAARETLQTSGLAARGWQPVEDVIAGTDLYTLALWSPADGVHAMLEDRREPRGCRVVGAPSGGAAGRARGRAYRLARHRSARDRCRSRARIGCSRAGARGSTRAARRSIPTSASGSSTTWSDRCARCTEGPPA